MPGTYQMTCKILNVNNNKAFTFLSSLTLFMKNMGNEKWQSTLSP